MATEVLPFKKYSVTPAPKTITPETFQAGALGSLLFGGPSARPMLVLLNLLVGSDPVKAIGELGSSIKLEDDRTVGGVPYKVLRITQEKGPGLRLLVDPQSKLLKAIDLIYDPTDLFEKGIQDNVTIDRLGWTAGTVATKDIPAGEFAFEPPQGFTKTESIAQAIGVKDKTPVEELVGKPAPNFTLTVLDGQGKIRTLSRDELAGKVVLIDFWATWCEPCLIELPEIQKLIEAYAKDRKEVLIVALSEDDEPSDLAELRKLVEKTLDEKKIKLTGTPVGLVGLDPSHSVRDAFLVDAFPTTVLLDGKGVIQAAHVGIPKGDFDEAVRTLGKEIDTLLEGKPLAPAAEAEPQKSNK
jgi:thiol-disulfide isomerase/thioredoxin